MFVIWDEDVDLKDWDIEAFCEDEEEYEEMTENEKWERITDMNYEYLEDERYNLASIKNNLQIVAFADLGLWNGRRGGYKFMNTTNIADCLRSFVNGISYMMFYVENGEFMAREAHHDGTNYYTFRFLKNGIDMYEFEELAYDSKKDINDYTMPIGKVILDYYGAVEV